MSMRQGSGVLTKQFNKVLDSEKMPEEWRKGKVVPISNKNCNVQSFSNYRGVKLMRHTNKDLGSLAKRRNNDFFIHSTVSCQERLIKMSVCYENACGEL